MKISVITVCFNSEAGILNAIESVKNQTYENVEHVIKDGGSTDETRNLVLSNIHDKAKFFSEKDSGIYDAINAGISYSTGDIIGLMHSDDTFHDSTVLSDVAAMFERGYDVVYGDLLYVSNDNSGKVIRKWKSKPYEVGMISLGWMPPHPTVYIRREVIKRVGPYKTYYRIAADYDYMVRLFSDKNLKIAYLERYFVSMKVGGASNKSVRNILRKSREDYEIMLENGFGIPKAILGLLYKNMSKVGQFIKSK